MTQRARITVIMIQLWLLSSAAASLGAASDGHGLHAEWLNEFMSAVRECARKAPAWHNEPDRIQRYIDDIEYHVEQMVTQAKKPDRARAKEEGQQLTALLRRGEGKGYLSPQDVESLIELMNNYLPVAQGASAQHTTTYPA